jgi:hypothetical protein
MEFIKTPLDGVAGFSGDKLVEKKFYFCIEPVVDGRMQDGERFEELLLKLVHLTDEEFAADYELDPMYARVQRQFPTIRKKNGVPAHRRQL